MTRAELPERIEILSVGLKIRTVADADIYAYASLQKSPIQLAFPPVQTLGDLLSGSYPPEVIKRRSSSRLWNRGSGDRYHRLLLILTIAKRLAIPTPRP